MAIRHGTTACALLTAFSSALAKLDEALATYWRAVQTLREKAQTSGQERALMSYSAAKLTAFGNAAARAELARREARRELHAAAERAALADRG